MNRTTTNNSVSRESEFPPTNEYIVGNRGLTARGACLLLLSNFLCFVCKYYSHIQNY